MGYRAQAMSRKNIRNEVLKIKAHFGIEDKLRVPIIEVFESLSAVFPDYNYEIVSDHELPNCHAETDISNKTIRLRESVYDGAYNNVGRDRMTIAHEIGHYCLHTVSSCILHREFDDAPVKAYEDPEWQAKCFAGEFLVPYHLTKDMTPAQIATRCGVSLEAAIFQYNVFRGVKGKKAHNIEKNQAFLQAW